MKIEHIDLTREIRNEICKAIADLGGNYEILSIIGSWGDTLPDKDILSMLKSWNKGEQPITPITQA